MNTLLFVFVALSLVAIQALAGGRTLALSLPAYGLLAVAAVLSWWPARRLEIPRRAALALTVSAAFFGYVILRGSLSSDGYLARRDIYTVLGALLLYLLVALNLTSSTVRVRLIFVLLLLASADGVIAAIQFAKGQNFMAFSFLPRADYGNRASGFFGCPNHLAGFLEATLLMGLGVACWSRWRPWAKLVAAYGVLVSIVGILLTGSRGGYLSALVGLLCFGVLSFLIVGRRLRKRVPYLVAAGVVIAVIVSWSVQVFVRESVSLEARAKSVLGANDARSLLWHAAVKEFQLHPVFGAGSGLYLYYGRQFREPGLQGDPVYVHNDYLQFLAEYGLVGMAGLLVFLASHLRGGMKAFTDKVSRQSDSMGVGSNSLAVTTGALSSAAACMAHSFVDFNLHIPANALLMAFVFGVLANPGGEIKVSSKHRKSGYRLGRHFRLVAPALGICTLVFALPTLPGEIFGEKARMILSDWRYLESPDVARAAEAFARRGLEYDAKNPELYYYLGESQVALATLATNPVEKQRHFGESVDSYRQGLELAPMDVRLVLCLGSSLDAVQRFSEADPLFAQALELDPLSGTTHWACALHLYLQGKLDEAEARYQKALEFGAGGAAQIGLERIKEDRKAQTVAPPPPVGPVHPLAPAPPASAVPAEEPTAAAPPGPSAARD